MKEQLRQYVDLLFAGIRDCEDIRQEILQNTLDRYDDLIAEGKTPEAAYRLAIIGIGDIGEILGTLPSSPGASPAAPVPAVKREADTPAKKFLRAVAVGLYILCPVPVIVLGNFPGWGILGVCGLLAMVAVATVLIMLGAKKDDEDEQEHKPGDPKSELYKSIDSLVWVIGLAAYFVLSFATNAWYVTWVIFPMIGAVKGLIRAILDLKEANNYEK